MKLHALLFTLLLGTLGFAQAQSPVPDAKSQPSPASEASKVGGAKDSTKSADGGVSFIQALPSPVTKGSKSSASKDPNMNADGGLSLSAGTLKSVVAEIERRIHHWTPKPEGTEWTMPNILYGPDAQEATVPGALTLRDVSPLQALTLAAAAAGCKLEPIFSTREENDPENQAQTIIGYRIVPDKRPGWGAANNSYSKNPLGLESQPQPKPSDNVRTSLGEVTTDPNFAVNTRDTKNYPLNFASNMPASADPFAIPSIKIPDNNRRFVRIYALGAILGGTREEIEGKEKYLQDLVSIAMQKSEPETGATSTGAPGSDAKPETSDPLAQSMPDLSFHLELRALVVRGTAAQHEIIEQVMKALKENEKQSTTPAAPTAPVTPSLPPTPRAR